MCLRVPQMVLRVVLPVELLLVRLVDLPLVRPVDLRLVLGAVLRVFRYLSFGYLTVRRALRSARLACRWTTTCAVRESFAGANRELPPNR